MQVCHRACSGCFVRAAFFENQKGLPRLAAFKTVLAPISLISLPSTRKNLLLSSIKSKTPYEQKKSKPFPKHSQLENPCFAGLVCASGM
jgi:hypothetical protein